MPQVSELDTKFSLRGRNIGGETEGADDKGEGDHGSKRRQHHHIQQPHRILHEQASGGQRADEIG